RFCRRRLSLHRRAELRRDLLQQLLSQRIAADRPACGGGERYPPRLARGSRLDHDGESRGSAAARAGWKGPGVRNRLGKKTSSYQGLGRCGPCAGIPSRDRAVREEALRGLAVGGAPMNEPLSLFDKIWQRHVVATSADGESLLYVDRNFLHE